MSDLTNPRRATNRGSPGGADGPCRLALRQAQQSIPGDCRQPASGTGTVAGRVTPASATMSRTVSPRGGVTIEVPLDGQVVAPCPLARIIDDVVDELLQIRIAVPDCHVVVPQPPSPQTRTFVRSVMTALTTRATNSTASRCSSPRLQGETSVSAAEPQQQRERGLIRRSWRAMTCPAGPSGGTVARFVSISVSGSAGRRMGPRLAEFLAAGVAQREQRPSPRSVCRADCSRTWRRRC